MKILIADDSQTIIEVIQFLLQSRGYEVITASDGIEAILKIYQTNPDLILLDIEMPKMNGYQVCRLLKHDETTKAIPIVILTSRDQKSDRFWGLSTGADEYMTKDFESEEMLFATIQRMLERRPSPIVADQEEQDFLRKRPTRPSPMSDAEISERSVLERVNHILDRQLFRATIVNELSYLAINMSSFSITIDSIFTLLAKVCEFRAAAILLKDHQGYSLFLYLLPPVHQQFLKALKHQVVREYLTYHPSEQLAYIEETLLNAPPSQPRTPVFETLNTFFALPLKVRNHVIGILALGHARKDTLNAEILETLQVFTNEASIVLDNALLMKQLEQSNQELEDTIIELKSTQAQLVQSEKMASLGQLVSGVAHEINTPAGAINAATANLMNFFPAIPENFRLLAEQHLSQADQQRLLKIVSYLFTSVRNKRRSTLSLRQEAKELEPVLKQDGFPNIKRLAKQIARLHINDALDDVLCLLKTYEPEPIITFIETCSNIVNASKDIKLSIDIITQIVNALKMYSRIDQAKVEEIDIHEGIETTLIILQNQIKEGIEVKRHYGNIPKIPCYANELNQVWTNIIHNALQAMNGRGSLTIETYQVPSENENLCGRSRGKRAIHGAKVGVKITDTGPGIPGEILDKIFDPYFTTKDQGEGSGLGLGIAQQIVKRHHGEIRVISEPGKTSFEVLLPISGLQETYLAQ